MAFALEDGLLLLLLGEAVEDQGEEGDHGATAAPASRSRGSEELKVEFLVRRDPPPPAGLSMRENNSAV